MYYQNMDRVEVTKVEGVINVHTKETGDMYIICNKQKDLEGPYDKDLRGLIFIFKPVLGEEQCVSTLLLYPEECEAMQEFKVSIAKDLGYMVTFDNGDLDFYNFGSHSCRRNPEGEDYVLDTYGLTQYQLDIPSSDWIDDDSIISQEYYNNHNHCGFKLAIHCAILNTNTVENIDLLHRQLPSEDQMAITRFYYKK